MAAVCVQVEWKNLMSFLMNPGDRVKKLNEHIRSQTKIPVIEQELLLNETPLKQHKKLSDYGIEESSTIHLVLRVAQMSDAEVNLNLVDVEGNHHPLKAKRSTSVKVVRQRIQQQTGVKPRHQVVVCNGKKLENGKTMAEYGIKNGTLLFMTYYCNSG
ncbi:ubiquitin D [Microcaecilia unicolor]|uniref:Ubiquitin D n=1 Tax=Microcaecilia unicolor TaxID=1415580 RepID=A0A6P7WRT0_9AMPH|nr:ubiquitin D [Microcaecilia unicolor]